MIVEMVPGVLLLGVLCAASAAWYVEVFSRRRRDRQRR